MFKKVIIPMPALLLEKLYLTGSVKPIFVHNPKTAQAREILKEISEFEEIFLGQMMGVPEVTQMFVEDELKNHPENVLVHMLVPEEHLFIHSKDVYNDLVYATGVDLDPKLEKACRKQLKSGLRPDDADVQVAIDEINLDWVYGMANAIKNPTLMGEDA